MFRPLNEGPIVPPAHRIITHKHTLITLTSAHTQNGSVCTACTHFNAAISMIDDHREWSHDLTHLTQWHALAHTHVAMSASAGCGKWWGHHQWDCVACDGAAIVIFTVADHALHRCPGPTQYLWKPHFQSVWYSSSKTCINLAVAFIVCFEKKNFEHDNSSLLPRCCPEARNIIHFYQAGTYF